MNNYLILKVFTAFVREHAVITEGEVTYDQINDRYGKDIRQDLQSVLNVVRRRFSDNKEYDDADYVVLDKCNFEEADLAASAEQSRAFYGKMNFAWSILRKCYAANCLFTEISFYRADFRRAIFRGSTLKSCYCLGADLSGADFRKASFNETDLSYATLFQTQFQGADLSKAIGLTQERIDTAVIDSNTKLPEGLINRIQTGEAPASPVKRGICSDLR